MSEFAAGSSREAGQPQIIAMPSASEIRNEDGATAYFFQSSAPFMMA